MKTTPKELEQALKALSQAYRKQIEAGSQNFDISPQATKARVARVLGGDFRFFVQFYFPHYIRSQTESELHQYLFFRLPEILKNPDNIQQAIAAPRGEAKSTLVSRLFTLFCLICEKKNFVVLVSDTYNQACQFLESIKAELEFNPRLQNDFPQHTGVGRVWQVGEILTAKNQKIEAAGSGKSLRGLVHGAYRPDLVILDDIENDEQVRSPEQRDKLQSWLNKTVLNLGAVDCKNDFIYIGTILHYDSVLNRTLHNPAWQSRVFKALKRLPENMALWDKWEELFVNDGESVADAYYAAHKDEMDKGAEISWQARPLLALMKIRASSGHATFDSEYQNDPVSSESGTFAQVLEHCFYKSLPNSVVYFGACDPSLGKAGASRDPSAILIGAYDRLNGCLYVVEAQVKKRLPDLIIEDIIRLQKQYQCVLWVVETVQFQEFLKTELVKRSTARGVPMPVRGVKPNTDKVLRIESLQPYFANGQIKLLPTQSALIEQLRHFPYADHDDAPDALHMLYMAASSFTRSNDVRVVHLPEPDFN